MTEEYRESTLADEIELAYGKALPAALRRAGRYGVYGSNGLVGEHDEGFVEGPGIVVGRKGTVGAVVYAADDFWPIDTTYYVVNKGDLNWRYLYHLLSTVGMTDMNSHSAVPGLNREDVYSISVQIPPRDVQRRIAGSLDFVESAIRFEEAAFSAAAELLRATTAALLQRGLRGESVKETELGIVPESWSALRLDECAKVVSTRMTYGQLESRVDSDQQDAVHVLGIKVSDMNRPGNEVDLLTAALEVEVDFAVARRQCASPGTIIFPKRGAAIATNKKRLAPTWTVFDPNVIGVQAGSRLNRRFLYYWFQTFDLRSITEPGPTPQLNKKNLDPLLVPVPGSLEEQQEIVSILDAIGHKVNLHRQRKATLEELFEVLRRALVSGAVDVHDLEVTGLPKAHIALKESA